MPNFGNALLKFVVLMSLSVGAGAAGATPHYAKFHHSICDGLLSNRIVEEMQELNASSLVRLFPKHSLAVAGWAGGLAGGADPDVEFIIKPEQPGHYYNVRSGNVDRGADLLNKKLSTFVPEVYNAQPMLPSLLRRALKLTQKGGALALTFAKQGFSGVPFLRMSLDFPQASGLPVVQSPEHLATDQPLNAILRIDIEVQPQRLVVLQGKSMGAAVDGQFVVSDITSHGLGLILDFANPALPSIEFQGDVKYLIGSHPAPELVSLVEFCRQLIEALEPEAQLVQFKAKKVSLISPLKGQASWQVSK